VLFVPPEPGPWLDRVLAVLRGRRGARVVVGVDAVDAAPPAPWWRRLLARGGPRAGIRAEALDAVLRRLAEARADVVVVDRTTGKVLGEGHRRAMVALARARAVAAGQTLRGAVPPRRGAAAMPGSGRAA
jgi:hypothetical protein